ncbi:hypothetical protein [Serratia marcescens]|uniref:hypothetical protein n=1 Tax=Serratia marcescens TaxID=615 RepID=UPI001B8E01B5|nr:hypothetical protein [Serratia marcescens]
MLQETYNLWSLIVYAISAGAALFMLWGVKGQIAEAVESNKINKLNSLLALEGQIAQRRQELSSSAIALKEFENIEKDERFDIAALRYNEAVQMYLNGLDRLCFCIKKGYLDKNDMKVEYREIIISAVKDHEEKFGKSTSYTNIIDIHDEWKRS